MAKVWESTLEDAVSVAVLLVLANYADDDGMNSFPGVARIARMSRYSERTVKRTIAELATGGWISISERGGGQGHLSGYELNVERLKRCQAVTVHKKRTVTAATGKGANGARKGANDEMPLFVSVIDSPVNHYPPAPLALGASAWGHGGVKALNRAADQVCSALGISNRRKRRLLRDVIALEAEKGDLPATIALAMISAWNAQAVNSPVLRVKFGLARFFSEGIWKDQRRWHWDEQRLRDGANARVGS